MGLLKLKPLSNPPSPFKWDISPPPITLKEISTLQSPPAAWLSGRDMKLFGSQPLSNLSDIGIVKCKDCDKPVLRSFAAEHKELCATIRAGKHKGSKGKFDTDPNKKRKSSVEPDDPSLPAKKKLKPAVKVTKGRLKGPVDYDKQCGVINDKGLPCSRSLTCKSHSMGAKRSVERSRPYDELLLDWQRANNPNFVEPVKRESKAEKKEKREREKQEKKRLEAEAAALLGLDASTSKKASAANAAKKASKKAAAAAVRAAEDRKAEAVSEDLDDLDSEAEVDALVTAVNNAHEQGVTGVPLAVPCDAGSWFVQRRERARCCRDLLVAALGNGGAGLQAGIGPVGLSSRTTSGSHTLNLRH
ncbi:SCA7-domain-containing protein [Coprinopsis marcescibilis]|uniref:SCA7-domain-containing protein n=1 Tax=Coprinopsis marcescibilis TaxID=230819 RepID=A0A5C3KBI8_COPMA|nr:SCA7-domain-containing protein [Coprinopsis marcescibilis]